MDRRAFLRTSLHAGGLATVATAGSGLAASAIATPDAADFARAEVRLIACCDGGGDGFLATDMAARDAVDRLSAHLFAATAGRIAVRPAHHHASGAGARTGDAGARTNQRDIHGTVTVALGDFGADRVRELAAFGGVPVPDQAPAPVDAMSLSAWLVSSGAADIWRDLAADPELAMHPLAIDALSGAPSVFGPEGDVDAPVYAAGMARRAIDRTRPADAAPVGGLETLDVRVAPDCRIAGLAGTDVAAIMSHTATRAHQQLGLSVSGPLIALFVPLNVWAALTPADRAIWAMAADATRAESLAARLQFRAAILPHLAAAHWALSPAQSEDWPTHGAGLGDLIRAEIASHPVLATLSQTLSTFLPRQAERETKRGAGAFA